MSSPAGHWRAGINLPQGIEERGLDLEGSHIRYLCGGTGPALLFIHGLLGYSFSWRFNLPVLAKHTTVYAPDLLGAGFSDRPPGLDCSLRATAMRVLQFLEALRITACCVVGTSHGGAIAMMLAAICAQQDQVHVQRLALVAPVNPWSSHGRWITRVLGTATGASLVRMVAPRSQFAYGRVLQRLYGDISRIPPGTLEGYSAPFEIPGAIEHPLAVVRTWRKDLDGLRSLLPRIASIPTLLIWGTRDRAVLPSSAPRLREQFENCNLIMLQGAGHLPYEEMPPEFNRALIDFVVNKSGTGIIRR
jgi:pimeloyl-ACP methyl ester carboxylesterase